MLKKIFEYPNGCPEEMKDVAHRACVAIDDSNYDLQRELEKRYGMDIWDIIHISKVPYYQSMWEDEFGAKYLVSGHGDKDHFYNGEVRVMRMEHYKCRFWTRKPKTAKDGTRTIRCDNHVFVMGGAQ